MKSRAKTGALLAAFAAVFLAGVSASAQAAELVAYLSSSCSYCRAWEIEIGRIYAKTPEGREAPLRRVDAGAKRLGLEAIK